MHIAGLLIMTIKYNRKQIHMLTFLSQNSNYWALVLAVSLVVGGCYRKSSSHDTVDSETETEVESDTQGVNQGSVTDDETPPHSDLTIIDSDDDNLDSDDEDEVETGSISDSEGPEDAGAEQDSDTGHFSNLSVEQCQVDILEGFSATEKCPGPCTEYSVYHPQIQDGIQTEETSLVIYEYDEHGVLKQEKSCWSESSYWSETEYTYDESQRLIRMEVREDGDVHMLPAEGDPASCVTQYLYDEEGRLIEEYSKEYLGYFLDTETTYTYDASGRLTEQNTSISGLSGSDSKTIYTYDELGRLKSTREETEEIGYKSVNAGQRVTETAFIYDSRGNLVSKRVSSISYCPADSITWPPLESQRCGESLYEYTYSYDEQGNLRSKVTALKSDNEDPSMNQFYDRTELYEYDKHGNLLSHEMKYANGTKIETYTYDCHR